MSGHARYDGAGNTMINIISIPNETNTLSRISVLNRVGQFYFLLLSTLSKNKMGLYSCI